MLKMEIMHVSLSWTTVHGVACGCCRCDRTYNRDDDDMVVPVADGHDIAVDVGVVVLKFGSVTHHHSHHHSHYSYLVVVAAAIVVVVVVIDRDDDTDVTVSHIVDAERHCIVFFFFLLPSLLLMIIQSGI